VNTAWEAEQQLPLLTQNCACFGKLGCLHDAPRAVGRLAPDQSDFDARFLEVGGLGLETVTTRPQGRLVLPSVMPVIDGSEASVGVHRATVAVLLEQTWRSGRDEASLRECLHLPPSVATLVAPFAPDDDLEALWRDRSNFLRKLLRLRPSAVTAPSYSTWGGESWLEHRYSMKRSLEFVRILQDHGLFAIPHLAWGRQRDAQDLADWLDQNRSNVVSVDAQCAGPIFYAWLAELAWLRDQLRDRPTLIVSGVRPGRRLRSLVAVWPESAFIYNGIRLAASHRELRLQSDGRAVTVRYGRPSTEDRPTLGLIPTDGDDPSPDLLYRRSLHEFERSVALYRGRQALAA
jgi:Domain of unknown function (DUF4417)